HGAVPARQPEEGKVCGGVMKTIQTQIAPGEKPHGEDEKPRGVPISEQRRWAREERGPLSKAARDSEKKSRGFRDGIAQHERIGYSCWMAGGGRGCLNVKAA
ncbi:MAG: uncharacterized protein A8A55_3687, partial [Amphiamblys sp. WSBS2006]